MQPSITGRRQVGSWVAAGKAQQHQQGLGPFQPLPPPMLQRLQRQWEGVAPRPGAQGQQAPTDMSDVLQSYQPAPACQEQQQQQQPAEVAQQQRPVNMFARKQQGQQAQQAQSPLPLQSQGATRSSQSSMWEAATAVQPSQATDQVPREQVDGAQPLQPITNQLSQQAQQQDSAACASSSASAAASQAQLWNRADQYRPPQQAQQVQVRQPYRGTPPAAAAGSKRKSSGGSGGKKAAKPLAPPAQRISRFFAPKAAKQQQ